MKIPTAADFMRRDVAFARPDQTLEELASFLTDEDVHGAPVVGDQGNLMGIVSRSDVVRALSESQEDEEPQAADPDAGGSVLVDAGDDGSVAPTPTPRQIVTAREIMSTQVVTAAPASTPGAIAELMSNNNIHRVVIMDKAKVVGLVSISDLLPLISGYEKSIAKAMTGRPRATRTVAKAAPAARKAARRVLRKTKTRTLSRKRAAGKARSRRR